VKSASLLTLATNGDLLDYFDVLVNNFLDGFRNQRRLLTSTTIRETLL